MVEKQLQIEASAAANGHAASQPPVSVGEVQLFLHDYKSFNMLTCLNSLTQLVSEYVFSIVQICMLVQDNGSVVEIIRIDRHERPTRPHSLLVKPT